MPRCPRLIGSRDTQHHGIAVARPNRLWVADLTYVAVATVLDRSGSMIFFDYVDITRICTRQAIDLMGIGDHVGLVSFGDDARVEFPATGTAVQEITGQPVKDTAMNAVNNIAFGGCTAMGDRTVCSELVQVRKPAVHAPRAAVVVVKVTS